MKLLTLFAGIGLAASHGLVEAANASLPTVDLGYTIHQATLNSSAQPYYNFSNIRYGQAPVGNLRFAPPLAPRGRNKTINDGQQGVICPQAGPAWIENASEFITTLLLGGNITKYENPMLAQSPPVTTNLSSLPKPDPQTSEDCLFLDVIVPTKLFNATHAAKKTKASKCDGNNTSTGAPVLVWIYGGGYTEGSKGSSGNPASLVARSQSNGTGGVIFVAMNYRLGLFGWLSGSKDITANAALLDQRLALNWVQKNIHLFGGDPCRVTVMGESAGGGSIMHHITSHGGKGTVPFQQAIPQSPAFQPFVPAQSKQIFAQVLGNASSIYNITVTNTKQLRNLTYEQLRVVNTIMVGRSQYGSFTFGPVVDPSPNSYVPDLPLRLIEQGKFHNVSLMVGHNSNEGLLFTPPFVQTEEQLTADFETIFPTANTSILTDLEGLYPPVFNGTYGYTNAIQRTSQVISDFLVGCNANALASKLRPSYAYIFSVSPGLHGEDVDYTFYNGEDDINDGAFQNPVVAVPFQRYLTQFAMTGRPTAEGYNPFLMYGQNDTVSIINANTLGAYERDPGARSQCEFWEKAPYYSI